MGIEKETSGGNAGCFHILPQELSQRIRQKDHTGLALAAHRRPSRVHRFGGDVPQLAHPDAGAADGLQHIEKLRPLGRCHKAGIFLAGKLPSLVGKEAALHGQGLHAAVGMAKEAEIAVDPGKHGVDAGGLVSLAQHFLVAYRPLLGDPAPVQPAQEGTDIPQILFYRGGAFLVLVQVGFKGLQFVHGVAPPYRFP